jgi:hypothetical protein
MIDRHTYNQCRKSVGETFSALLWANRPGDAANVLMRHALARSGPPVTDAIIADELAHSVVKWEET